MEKPKKWVEVYPYGTKEGVEESCFFKSLARHPKYDWRSISMIMKETGLSRKRVEELLAKYVKLGMVFQNPSNDDNYGYWERVPQMLKDKPKSIAETDKLKRIDQQRSGVLTTSI